VKDNDGLVLVFNCSLW